ncbi:MAG: MmcQ/YjbR family DNA-binding protein [Candidatus Sulfotelmatobacter sp.]
MTPVDFRRIALSFEGAEEGSHMGAADFRVRGKIFATLASQKQGYGNIKLTPEQQAEFVHELPEVFLPVSGGWGKGGMTHVRLARATEDVLEGALRTAWKLRVANNTKTHKAKKKTRTQKRPSSHLRRFETPRFEKSRALIIDNPLVLQLLQKLADVAANLARIRIRKLLLQLFDYFSEGAFAIAAFEHLPPRTLQLDGAFWKQNHPLLLRAAPAATRRQTRLRGIFRSRHYLASI